MITKQQLFELAGRSNINPYYQEKDYLINIFLKSLYQTNDSLVFKGGTCLKVAYNHPRFSEDLDFNTAEKPQAARRLVHKTLEDYLNFGVEYEVAREELFRESYTAKIRLKGPLYSNRPDSTNTIQLDIGLRDEVLLKPVWRQVISPYPDVPNYMVYAMRLEEIYAEKIRALLSRRKGRDLYDLWMLTPQVEPDRKTLDKKTGLGRRQITLPAKEEYENDIQNLLPNPPPYAQIKKQVEETLERLKQSMQH